MAYDFKKLSDVQSSAEISDNANILVEEEGVIKRVPKSEIGGNEEAVYAELDALRSELDEVKSVLDGGGANSIFCSVCTIGSSGFVWIGDYISDEANMNSEDGFDFHDSKLFSLVKDYLLVNPLIYRNLYDGRSLTGASIARSFSGGLCSWQMSDIFIAITGAGHTFTIYAS